MDNLQRVYLKQNLLLAKTLVIKSEATADSINDNIKLLYGEGSVDTNFPETWKYYLNISGEYHSSDKTMVITSLDTLEEIVFNKENLLLHTSTYEAYQYGSRYYDNLIDKYRDQEMLILGILYPCDITTAIEAKDHTVLSYPEYLVETQELTLIPELQEFIYKYYARWDIDAFNIAHEYYRAAQLGVFYLNLVPKLLNMRLARCHSNETHSFHIREYLASHGELDKYMDYMTLEQQLFLYRNIRWLDRNAGKTETFKLLIAKMLTKRHIPISEYSVRQLSNFTDEAYPIIQVRKKPINTQYNMPEKDYFTVKELTDKEIDTAEGNEKYLDEHLASIERTFQNSDSSVIQTKDLESSMTDSSDAVPDPLEVVLVRQWGYLAAKGYYNSIINFKDTVTFESRSLTAVDAFIYMQYIATKSEGIDVKVVQDFMAYKYRRLYKPSKSELLSVVNNNYADYNSIADELLQRHPTIKACTSIKAFYELNRKIYDQCKYEWYLTSYIDDIWQRGEVENMCQVFYAMERVSFPDAGKAMSVWLKDRGLPEYNYSVEQAQDLVKAIYLAGSGIVYNAANSLREIQKAMMSVMKQLSSYSIQFIYDINDSKVIPLNWPALRFGNQKGKAEIYQKTFSRLEVVDVRSEVEDYQFMDLTDTNPLSDPTLTYSAVVDMKHALDLEEIVEDHKTVAAYHQALEMQVYSKSTIPLASIAEDDNQALNVFIDHRRTSPVFAYDIGYASEPWVETKIVAKTIYDNISENTVIYNGLDISFDSGNTVIFDTLSLEQKLTLKSI